MEKTRTPLQKWIAAIDALSTSGGLSAAQLAIAIGATRKVAWTMLRKFRAVMEQMEQSHKLKGKVCAGVRAFAPQFIWMYLPDRKYKGERVVALFASACERTGKWDALRMVPAKEADVTEGTKLLTVEGAKRLRSRTVDSSSAQEVTWLGRAQMNRSSLLHCFEQASRWLNETFNGVPTASLNSHLAEFCFRWGITARGSSPTEEWYRLCFPPRGKAA
ncbi:hypothetical protein MO973_04165 [Paenibacillus sp. TRM 82003]|nr:hypothetical protein [Paenibacillus sp. TRM 82003]